MPIRSHFAALGVCGLVVLPLSAVLYIALVGNAARPEPVFVVSEHPIRLTAYPIANLIPADDLKRIRRSLRPNLDTDQFAGTVPIPMVLHALRFSGGSTRFAAHSTDRGAFVDAPDGRRMVQCLLDHREFSRTARFAGDGLLTRSAYGVRVLTAFHGLGTNAELATHFGKVAQVLGEVGVPSHYQVRTMDNYSGTVADIVREDAASISPGVELEFVACAIARYGARQHVWYNRFGNACSFDSVANSLMSSSPESCACRGTHLPHALIVMLRCDSARHLLSHSCAADVREFLQKMSGTLQSRQRADGSWDWDWPTEGKTASVRPFLYRDDLVAKLVITGHHLEWMAFAPPDCRPPREVIRRAALWVCAEWPNVIQAMQADWHVYMPASHAGRALALLTGARVGEWDGGLR